ncbi:nicotinate-nucleotide adenylyltransferase [Novosphingobium pokkalii]|uniref:Probable nicotinate-nucleotide adenylyltransferase n=1 Tax=Novosphingobium pokkalii TaxID=1770194 RepID=A0ABV7V0J7_9SPHN|nr:nicotinate-nucleotide adenylyltransferase [Novosphingobium pokkalii]
MAGPRQRAGSVLTRRQPRLTGLLGGSFNPAHGGHRRVSLFARAALGLDEVWWLVSPGNVLKPAQGMAPLPARVASARRQARRAPIRVTAIERELGTRYTIDSLRALVRRYPRRRFIWLMGADNLAQFHRWKDWRAIARTMPIAVVARPGYDAAAMASPAMVWLRRWRRRCRQECDGALWPDAGPAGGAALNASFPHDPMQGAPALFILRFDPDPRSATALRRAEPDWAGRLSVAGLRDGVTHRRLAPACCGRSGR